MSFPWNENSIPELFLFQTNKETVTRCIFGVFVVFFVDWKRRLSLLEGFFLLYSLQQIQMMWKEKKLQTEKKIAQIFVCDLHRYFVWNASVCMETSDISVVFSAQKDNIAPRKNAATLLVFFIQLFCISIHFFHCFGSKISSGVFEMERKKKINISETNTTPTIGKWLLAKSNNIFIFHYEPSVGLFVHLYVYIVDFVIWLNLVLFWLLSMCLCMGLCVNVC